MDGSLIIVGGGLKESLSEVYSELIKRAGGKDSRFAYFSTASSLPPDELFGAFRQDMAALGVNEENIVQIPLYAPEIRDGKGRNLLNGDAPLISELLEGVSGVWFSGGDQRRIKNALLRSDGSDTAGLEKLRKILSSGGVIGGTSAGAAMMSRVMIGGGSEEGVLSMPLLRDYPPSYTGESLVLSRGPGFFPEGIVDQHFNKRPRLLRLIESCIENSEGLKIGYGISEDTALICSGEEISVLGSASIYIADCRRAVKTGPGSYSGVILSALQKGDRLDIKNHHISLAGDEIQGEKTEARDFLQSFSPASPEFDKLIYSALILGDSGSLARSDDGRPCLKSAEFLSCAQGDYALKLSYIKRPETRGYRAERSSFTQIEFESKAVKI